MTDSKAVRWVMPMLASCLALPIVAAMPMLPAQADVIFSTPTFGIRIGDRPPLNHGGRVYRGPVYQGGRVYRGPVYRGGRVYRGPVYRGGRVYRGPVYRGDKFYGSSKVERGSKIYRGGRGDDGRYRRDPQPRLPLLPSYGGVYPRY